MDLVRVQDFLFRSVLSIHDLRKQISRLDLHFGSGDKIEPNKCWLNIYEAKWNNFEWKLAMVAMIAKSPHVKIMIHGRPDW